MSEQVSNLWTIINSNNRERLELLPAVSFLCLYSQFLCRGIWHHMFQQGELLNDTNRQIRLRCTLDLLSVCFHALVIFNLWPIYRDLLSKPTKLMMSRFKTPLELSSNVGDVCGGTSMYLKLNIQPNIRPLGYFLFNKSCRSEILQMKW